MDELTPMSRHFMIKCICEFIKMPNQFMVKKMTEIRLEEETELRKLKNVRTDVGPTILPKNQISKEILEKIPFPVTLYAKDFVKKAEEVPEPTKVAEKMTEDQKVEIISDLPIEDEDVVIPEVSSRKESQLSKKAP